MMKSLSPTLRQSARPTLINASARGARRAFVVHAATDTYVSPSYRAGSTELQALERYSEVRGMSGFGMQKMAKCLRNLQP